MSDLKGTQLVESFATKLDIEMVSPVTYAKMIEAARATPRMVVCVVGPPGIGKSVIPKQIAKGRGAPYAGFFIPQMSVEDCHIPTSAADTKQYFDWRIPRKWQRILDYTAKTKAENGGVVPDGKQAIISLEELNRARDEHVTQAMFTLLEDRMIGDTYIDESIQLIVTMNPSGAAHAVNEFERDPACRRRLSMVGLGPSFGDFIRFAAEGSSSKLSQMPPLERSQMETLASLSVFHPQVIKHLEAQPTWFYDYNAALGGKQFACPASWDTVSQILCALDARGIAFDEPAARALIAGKIGDVAATAFLEFTKDNTIVIAPDEVLLRYDSDASVQKRFKKDYLAEGKDAGEVRMDKVDTLLHDIALKMFSDSKKEPKRFGKSVAKFMDDLPDEKLKLFVRNMVEESRLGEEAKRYLQKFNQMLTSEPYFLAAAKRLNAAETKVQTEREKTNFNS